LVQTLSSLANVLIGIRQFDEAEQTLRRSLEVAEKLATDFPDVPGHRDTFAAGLETLGVNLARRDRNREAREAFERSYEIRRKLVADTPDLSVLRQSLAATCYAAAVNYATLTGWEGRDAARSRELARESVAIEPQGAGFWKGLALAEYRVGDIDA